MFRWLGLVWYRARVLSVIRQHYGLEPAVVTGPLFNQATRLIYSKRGNDYDGAAKVVAVKSILWRSGENAAAPHWGAFASTSIRLMPLMRYPEVAARDLEQLVSD